MTQDEEITQLRRELAFAQDKMLDAFGDLAGMRERAEQAEAENAKQLDSLREQEGTIQWLQMCVDEAGVEVAALKRDLEQLANLREEAMGVLRDAERYRWLRMGNVEPSTHSLGIWQQKYGAGEDEQYPDGITADAAIDRARTEEKKDG